MPATAVDHEHGGTPRELFFDLVFVFAFTQVATLLANDPTFAGSVAASEPRCERSCRSDVRKLRFALLAAGLCSAAVGAGSPTPSWRLAYASESPGRRGLDIYVATVPNGKPRRVAGVSGRDDFCPSWSPNGRSIAYRTNPLRGDEGDIMVVSATGGGPRNLTKSPAVADWSPAWSPDGRSIA